jgi:hypothetical protein
MMSYGESIIEQQTQPDPIREIKEIVSENPELVDCLSPLERMVVEAVTN